MAWFWRQWGRFGRLAPPRSDSSPIPPIAANGVLFHREPRMTHSGRFDAFVWISAGLHVLVAALVLAWALSAPRPKPPTAIFELVGIPPRGNGGGEVRSARPEPTPPTPPAAAPAPTPAAPEKVPAKVTPTPPPDKASAKVLPKTPPSPPAKPLPGPTTTKSAPSTGTAKTESVANSAGSPAAGTHPGTAGRP